MSTNCIAYKIFLVLFLGLSSQVIFAQQLSPFVVNCNGQSFSNSSAQLDFNVGEVAITSIGTVNNSITQGLLQPQATVTAIHNNETADVFSVFPNPTTDQVEISSTSYSEPIYAKLIDYTGRVLVNEAAQNNTVSVAQLPVGIYQLVLLDKNQKILSRKTISKI